MEGATVSQAKALATGAQVAGGGEVAYPLAHVIGEKGAAKLAKVLKAIDPFPDVDSRLVGAFGLAGVFIPGLGAVPSGLEIAALTMKDIKSSISAVGEVGSIISKSPELKSVKDFTRSVVDSVTNRIQQAASPQMTQARAAFGVV